MTAYRKLCTEFYNQSKPRAEAKEIEFYESFLKNFRGPFLGAMCGSGRLLIPLLEKGYSIDGVDNSPEMLERCLTRCKEKNLKIELFNQSLQHLSLPRKYGLIFIAGCSFQLIENRSVALTALKKLHEYLLPDGVLLLETFIPWDAIKDCVDGSIIKEKITVPFEKKVTFPNGIEIIHKGKNIVYAHEQLEASESRYDKFLHKKMLETENEQLKVRWYYRYEMELFLNKSGFSQVETLDKSFELNPQAIIYKATK